MEQDFNFVVDEVLADLGDEWAENDLFYRDEDEVAEKFRLDVLSADYQASIVNEVIPFGMYFKLTGIVNSDGGFLGRAYAFLCKYSGVWVAHSSTGIFRIHSHKHKGYEVADICNFMEDLAKEYHVKEL